VSEPASIEEGSLYELLDVSEEATPEEIERAYRIAAGTYQPGSAATYSVFSDEESAELLRQVERAYAVLSDPRRRRDYDARRRSQAPVARRPGPPPPRPAERRPQPTEVEVRVELEIPEPEDGVYDGPVLHRIRVSRGVEIEEIAQVTKINPVFIRDIEANRYEALPAIVYVRGFVREIARALHLDPVRVTETYMKRYRDKGGRA
jgi:flagellar biosynthesis protein FlhG